MSPVDGPTPLLYDRPIKPSYGTASSCSPSKRGGRVFYIYITITRRRGRRRPPSNRFWILASQSVGHSVDSKTLSWGRGVPSPSIWVATSRYLQKLKSVGFCVLREFCGNYIQRNHKQNYTSIIRTINYTFITRTIYYTYHCFFEKSCRKCDNLFFVFKWQSGIFCLLMPQVSDFQYKAWLLHRRDIGLMCQPIRHNLNNLQ